MHFICYMKGIKDMERLTKEQILKFPNTSYGRAIGKQLANQVVQELLAYKEEEINVNLAWGNEDKPCIDLVTLSQIEREGFYYKKDNEIYYCRNCIRVGTYFIETKPCYAVKETTLESCYYGDVSEVKPVEDAHYWSWKTSLHVSLKDYGKTWARTREELK